MDPERPLGLAVVDGGQLAGRQGLTSEHISDAAVERQCPDAVEKGRHYP